MSPDGPTPPIAPRERFLRAARGEGVDAPPVWLMRQAGRLLPEYREVRARVSFLELCRTVDLATEVSLQPHRRFRMDGVVVFSDILLPLAGLGLELDFRPGPVVANPIEKESDLRLLEGDPEAAIAPTCDAIRRLRRELGDTAAVIGFAGAPWTLAAYALEQTLSRDVSVICGLAYRAPALLDRLLDRMTEICVATLEAQWRAGADVLQIFDTWAGVLHLPHFRRFAGRALDCVLRGLPEGAPPVIVYARGATHLLDALIDLRPDVVSLDWRVPLSEAARRAGGRVSLQGNLDPAALNLPPAEIESQVSRLIEEGRAARGHILNLGHGILPSIPVRGVEAFVRAAQRARA